MKWRRVPREHHLVAGESVLRRRRTLFNARVIRRACRVHARCEPAARRKGRRLTFRHRVRRFIGGDAKEPRDVARSPGESFLFFLTTITTTARAASPLTRRRGARGAAWNRIVRRSAATVGRAAQPSRRPVRCERPLKIGGNGTTGTQCRQASTRPYPYPQQVSKVRSL